jgi:hypothetical protein
LPNAHEGAIHAPKESLDVEHDYADQSGQVFYKSPEDVHTVSRNASKTKPAKFVVFFIKNEGAPILTPIH